MSNERTAIGPNSSAAQVLDLMLSDRVRYPCLSAMIYQLAEALQGSDPPLANDCWNELNLILSGSSDPASVRRFIARHSAGTSMEARAFKRALIYLVDEDETRRDQFLGMTAPSRQDFVKCRLWHAADMRVEQGIAL